MERALPPDSVAAPATEAWKRLIVGVGVGYLAAWAIGVGFGLVLQGMGIWQGGAAWEHSMLAWIHDRPLPPFLDSLMLAVVYAGTNLTLLPLILVVGFVLWRRYHARLVAIQLIVVALGSLSLNPTMKHLLARPRPPLYPMRGMWTWEAYPSGHLILTPALYFTISLMLYRKYGWRWPFVVTVAVMATTAYSRLYLAVHWPTDLVGGLLIGITWLVMSWRAFHTYFLETRGGLSLAAGPDSSVGRAGDF